MNYAESISSINNSENTSKNSEKNSLIIIPDETNNLDNQDDQNLPLQNSPREGTTAPPKPIMVCNLESISDFVKDLEKCDQKLTTKVVGKWTKVLADSHDNKSKIIEFL